MHPLGDDVRDNAINPNRRECKAQNCKSAKKRHIEPWLLRLVSQYFVKRYGAPECHILVQFANLFTHRIYDCLRLPARSNCNLTIRWSDQSVGEVDGWSRGVRHPCVFSVADYSYDHDVRGVCSDPHHGGWQRLIQSIKAQVPPDRIPSNWPELRCTFIYSATLEALLISASVNSRPRFSGMPIVCGYSPLISEMTIFWLSEGGFSPSTS